LQCRDTWARPDKTPQICQLIYEQVFNMKKDEAARRVQTLPLPDCAHEIVTQPEGAVAMLQRETTNKVSEKLGGLESMQRGQQSA
jgi:hypothetical protein